jgi:hypothetical protein
MLLTLLLRQVLALLDPMDPLLEPPLKQPPLLLPPPVLEQRLQELPLEQLERSLPLLDQLEMLDPLLVEVEVEVELDLLLRRCWSSFAAESEERSEVLCVYIYSFA